MKTAVLYVSKTGHSKKLGEAIAKELNITAFNMKSNPKLNGIDLLFLVGGIYGGQSAPDLLEYVKTIDNTMVKKVVLVTSCASKQTKQNAVRDLLKEKNIEVSEEEFICQGSFLVMGWGHPNKIDISNAVSFAKEIVKVGV